MDMIGNIFGKLKVVDFSGKDKSGSLMWKCQCECGETRIVAGTGLRAGRNKSCGCASPRFTSDRVKTHGASKTRAYSIFSGMHRRCSDKARGKTRKLYYDKGIRVCKEWDTFEQFILDMGHPEPWQSIDRIDGNKGYYKNNCRWASKIDQANNTSLNHILTFKGETKTISEWALLTGIKANTLIYRIRRGWEINRVFEKNIIPLHTLKKLERKRKCPICGAEFIPRKSQIRDAFNITCSQKCNAKNRHIKKIVQI